MASNTGEVRTSDSHPLPVAWVELDTAPGELGVAMAPGRRGHSHFSPAAWERDLHADLRRLRHVHRCDVLVTLLPLEELDELGLGSLGDAVAVHGILHRHLPVRDGGVPTPDQDDAVLDLVDELRTHLLAGRTAVLHCRAGFGRAGTLAAIVVASLWELPAEAIARVRGAQPRAVETVQQEHYVHDAAYRWFHRHVERRDRAKRDRASGGAAPGDGAPAAGPAGDARDDA
jgi:protein-tyrosine phosphatase